MIKAFSFVEVIISAFILSFMGMAILNFNTFNKNSMENSISKQSTLLISSPLLTIDTDIDTNKDYELFDLVEFSNLDDDDKNFLKDISIGGTKEFRDKIFLYSDDDGDYYIDYGIFKINYGDNKKIPYIYLQRSK